MDPSFNAEAAWDLATAIVIAVVILYSMYLYQIFKGGRLSKAYTLELCGFGVLLATFALRFLLDLAGIDPVQSFGISVRDVGVLIAVILLALSVREMKIFWRNEKR